MMPMRWVVVALASLVVALPVMAEERWTLVVSNARTSVDSLGFPAIELSLTPAAQAIFAEVTASRVGQVVQLVVDGEVVMAPVVQTVINTPSLQLTGNFTAGEAAALAARIAEAGAVVEAVAPGPGKTKVK